MGSDAGGLGVRRGHRPRRRVSWSILATLAVLYPCALAAVAAVFRYVGEDSATVVVALYLPRVVFALPLPACLFVAWRLRSRVLLGSQLVAVWLLLFPLMGLEVSWPARAQADEPAFRVLTYNTFLGRRGPDVIRDEIVGLDPDVVLFQALASRTAEYFRKYPLPGYVVERHGEFWMASRFPVLSVDVPPEIPERPPIQPSFVRYTLATPLGPVDVYNVHPLSPRTGLEALRGSGLLDQVRSGRILELHLTAVDANTYVRERQIQALSAHAKSAPNPVLIAGDTNLPGLSRLLAESFGRYEDGFTRAGTGFGYTFPAHRVPWMRIDRILADPGLRFTGFAVGCPRGSDHYCVVADVARAELGR
jgi:endonuclease/exonuclease/phosphatase (EEP) superfamily protein YafD